MAPSRILSGVARMNSFMITPRWRITAICGAVLALMSRSASGAEVRITRDNYLSYAQIAVPRAIHQTAASKALHDSVYGSSIRASDSLRDVRPRNGIDDARD